MKISGVGRLTASPECIEGRTPGCRVPWAAKEPGPRAFRPSGGPHPRPAFVDLTRRRGEKVVSDDSVRPRRSDEPRRSPPRGGFRGIRAAAGNTETRLAQWRKTPWISARIGFASPGGSTGGGFPLNPINPPDPIGVATSFGCGPEPNRRPIVMLAFVPVPGPVDLSPKGKGRGPTLTTRMRATADGCCQDGVHAPRGS